MSRQLRPSFGFHVPAQVVRGSSLAHLVGDVLQWNLRGRAWWKVILWDGREINEWDPQYVSPDSEERRILLDTRMREISIRLSTLSVYNPAHQDMMMNLMQERSQLNGEIKRIGLSDWSLIPHGDIRMAILIAPSGDHAIFTANEGGLFFQFKLAYYDMGSGDTTAAQVLGKVVDTAGNAELAMYTPATQSLSDIRIVNVWNTYLDNIPLGELCGPAVGLTKIDNQLQGRGGQNKL